MTADFDFVSGLKSLKLSDFFMYSNAKRLRNVIKELSNVLFAFVIV